ncbi:MAG TPA: ATP-binding protein [Bdellovibrionota bacterium]|jgi:signal transduction histidine kinase|nr:ATP-binding protein [Bdellovibrionota bacterium]
MRVKILASVGALVLLSLLGSTVSLLRITEVRNSLDAINGTAIPFGRILTQLQADADILEREMERRLGTSHWKDPRWHAQPLPRWVIEVLDHEVQVARGLTAKPGWLEPQEMERWNGWLDEVTSGLDQIQTRSRAVYDALVVRDLKTAAQLYPDWSGQLDTWGRRVEWGAREYERSLRRRFTSTESSVSGLRGGLQVILGVVVVLSLLLLWLGERALRPLAELTALARQIAQRGLRKEDKAKVPSLSLGRGDEVSGLAREFHRMATALLERERTVETQNSRLEAQNLQLREMGELERRLHQAENLAAVGRMSAQVAHEVRNPLHSIGLEAEYAIEALKDMSGVGGARQSLQSILSSVDRLEKITQSYLRLSRLSEGVSKPVDLRGVLESVLATYYPVCENRGVKVDWNLERGAQFMVQGDPDLLEQVFGNLFRNALDALEGKGGKIEWRLGNTEDGKVWLRIQDDGTGVPVEVMPKLFSPFVTTKAHGTGLGLSFCRKVVQDHGGDLKLLPSPQGACFEMTLGGLTT